MCKIVAMLVRITATFSIISRISTSSSLLSLFSIYFLLLFVNTFFERFCPPSLVLQGLEGFYNASLVCPLKNRHKKRHRLQRCLFLCLFGCRFHPCQELLASLAVAVLYVFCKSLDEFPFFRPSSHLALGPLLAVFLAPSRFSACSRSCPASHAIPSSSSLTLSRAIAIIRQRSS